MALLAEELVEEWLNRQGYFTIRGIKIGVQEIDLLAVKSLSSGIECRHVEVQASMRPVSYISRVPAAAQKEGRAANSAKRTKDELIDGVAEWVEKKFRHPKKLALMKSLWQEQWSSELVINKVKSEDEVALIQGHGIKVIRLQSVVSELAKPGNYSAAGADFVDLIHMSGEAQQSAPAAKKRCG